MTNLGLHARVTFAEEPRVEAGGMCEERVQLVGVGVADAVDGDQVELGLARVLFAEQRRDEEIKQLRGRVQLQRQHRIDDFEEYALGLRPQPLLGFLVLEF